MSKITLRFILLFLLSNFLIAQELSVRKIEPPNWWTGMKLDTLQLMVYGDNLHDVDVKSNDPDFVISKIHRLGNPSYLFVDVLIGNDCIPGKYDIYFNRNEEEIRFEYPLDQREFEVEEHSGFTDEDVVYLIFADRFNNGNPRNDTLIDSIDEYKYKSLNGRHGGDIQGIIDKLDYLRDLGITAIWITPMLENNMHMSYHGYAATNLYKIDERFGTNELYRELVNEANSRGIKVIYDHVSNHIGINHEWINDLPQDDWINGTVEKHKNANHDKISIVDIHSTGYSKELNETGWFTDYMADLNQRNEFLSKYLIQNMIWWIEYSGLDGIREDTYPYANQKFQSRFAEVILTEYPDLNIVGEIWTGEPAFLAGFQKNSKVRKDIESNLPSVIDFGMRDALVSYLKGGSIYEIYKTFAMDYLYPDPNNLMVFMDNHDVDRAMFIAEGNIKKYKIALAILLTSRGIPQLFYGTEIGIEGGGHHGEIRKPFPGGFTGDVRNAFTEGGRTGQENSLFNYTRKLLHLRKKYGSLSQGEFVHFMPNDETYVYFKEKGYEKIMVIVNNNFEEKEVDLSRMKYELEHFEKALDLTTGNVEYSLSSGGITISGFAAKIFLLQ